MIQNSGKFSIGGWYGLAGGISSQQDWALWAKQKLQLRPTLPKPHLKLIPTRISRRLDILGRCVLSASEQCLPLIKTDAAVITTSRHGDLPHLDKLIQCARDNADISPTDFTYSVHNRFSSLISMVATYHGVNGAYSSVRDGFPLALAEAISLLEEDQASQVLLVAFEPEIPEPYQKIISASWRPHIAAFILQSFKEGSPVYSLLRQSEANPEEAEADLSERGSCLPFIRTLLNKSVQRDGFWEYRYCE